MQCEHVVVIYSTQNREKKSVRVQADDPISFLQLIAKGELGATEVTHVTRTVYAHS